MNLTKFVGPTALVIGLTVPAFAAAQDAPPPIPKPGPEHALFKMDAGTWDATVEVDHGAWRTASDFERRGGQHHRLRWPLPD